MQEKESNAGCHHRWEYLAVLKLLEENPREPVVTLYKKACKENTKFSMCKKKQTLDCHKKVFKSLAQH
jgi:hypothetical protein